MSPNPYNPDDFEPGVEKEQQAPAESQHPLALALAQKQETPAQSKPIDPTEARNEAVAHLLRAAYEKASTLELTPEECAKLAKEFRDDEVLRGADGKEDLLYVSHSSIRQRLFEVFGPGKWSCVLRRHWLDEKGGWMYAECALLVRGCFVGEAIGAGRYVPGNPRMNYSDASEAAQSEAIRRIAGKYLGVGLQVWNKAWCEGWWQRKTGKSDPAHARKPVTQPAKPAPAPASQATAPAQATEPAPAAETPEQKLVRWVAEMRKTCPDINMLRTFAVENGWLLPNEEITDLHPSCLPKTKGDAQARLAALGDWVSGIGPATPAATPKQAEFVQPEIPEGAIEVTGFLKKVTKKPTAKGGTRYGLLFVDNLDDKDGGVWVNTFDDKDGAAASAFQGHRARCHAVHTDYGHDLVKHTLMPDEDIAP